MAGGVWGKPARMKGEGLEGMRVDFQKGGKRGENGRRWLQAGPTAEPT